MTMSKQEYNLEEEHLKKVIKDIDIAIQKHTNLKAIRRSEVKEANKQMWVEGKGSINDIGDAVINMQFADMIKSRIDGYVFAEKMLNKLHKLYISPYFGRIDFIENMEHETGLIYIGISTFQPVDRNDILIYDWRAPVCSMFYESELGETGYDSPMGFIGGKLTLKRQYRIYNQEILSMFDSSLKIDDEILQDILAKSTDSKMRTIVSSIQKEQNKVIRNEKYKYLIVQGPAGSGKTSIALHRVAYLLYRYREKITSDNIIVFSPNYIFNDYISDVLPQLGEENMKIYTFMDLAEKMINDRGKYKFITVNDQMEAILSTQDISTRQISKDCIEFKSSYSFFKALKRYVSYIENKGLGFNDIKCNDDLIIGKEELDNLYCNVFSGSSVKARLERIKNRVLESIDLYEKTKQEEIKERLLRRGKGISEDEAVLITRKKVFRITEAARKELIEMVEIDLIQLYLELFEEHEFKSFFAENGMDMDLYGQITFQTVEQISAGFLMNEDIIPVMFLMVYLGYCKGTENIRHIIIDEMQDYSILQYAIFKKLYPVSSMTLLGDINQAINFYSRDVFDSLNEALIGEDIMEIKLTKSYRSTKEITQFCSSIIGNYDTHESINRCGNKPVLTEIESENGLYSTIAERINELKKTGFNSIAVIGKTSAVTYSLFESLKDRIDIKLISKNDERFSKGIVVIPSYMAKGLEFDAVLVVNTDNSKYEHNDEKGLFYTICSRALHYLEIYYKDELPTHVKDIDENYYEVRGRNNKKSN